MKKIPIVLEQYECIGCKHKWYINTEDKVDNQMTCPYECEFSGLIKRKFDMMIHDYNEYINGEEMTLNREEPQTGEEINEEGVDGEANHSPSMKLKGGKS